MVSGSSASVTAMPVLRALVGPSCWDASIAVSGSARFCDQSTRMYWRSLQGRSFSFSEMTFVSSPVPGLYSRLMSEWERIL